MENSDRLILNAYTPHTHTQPEVPFVEWRKCPSERPCAVPNVVLLLFRVKNWHNADIKYIKRHVNLRQDSDRSTLPPAYPLIRRAHGPSSMTMDSGHVTHLPQHRHTVVFVHLANTSKFNREK